MQSFPSSWIIGTGSTAPVLPSSPPPAVVPVAVPVAVPAVASPTAPPPAVPPKTPSPAPQRRNDNDGSSPLPFRRRRRRSSLLSLGDEEAATQTLRCCCCSDDIYPEHLRPGYRDPLKTAKPMPQQSPFVSTSKTTGAIPPPQYPARFPSSWFLGAQTESPPPVRSQQQHKQSCPHRPHTSRPPSFSSPLRNSRAPTEACPLPSLPPFQPPRRSTPTPDHTHDNEGSQREGRQRRRTGSFVHWEQSPGQTQHLSSRIDVDEDILRELKGSPRRHEEIDSWIQSMSQVLPRSSSRRNSLHSGTSNGGPWWARERHPSEFSEASDDSGLGDAPHRGLDVPSTYSIYATSAYARGMARS